MTANVRSLGWLGTGRMGAALAGRLIEAGERVTVWNRTAGKTAPLVSAGARAVERITGLRDSDFLSLYEQQARVAALGLESEG